MNDDDRKLVLTSLRQMLQMQSAQGHWMDSVTPLLKYVVVLTTINTVLLIILLLIKIV